MAAKQLAVQVHNAGGTLRVLSTKPMPGTQWIKTLTSVGCRVEASPPLIPIRSPCSVGVFNFWVDSVHQGFWDARKCFLLSVAPGKIRYFKCGVMLIWFWLSTSYMVT